MKDQSLAPDAELNSPDYAGRINQLTLIETGPVHVQTLKSAHRMMGRVTVITCAPTPRAHSSARVTLVISWQRMDERVKMSMNVL